MEDPVSDSRGRLVGKYFLHGLLYSLFSLGLGFVLAFLTVFLVFVGLWIGLIIGFLLLLLVFGAINVFLMNELWDVSVKSDLLSLFLHGLVLTIAFLLVAIPIFIVNMLIPSVAMTIMLFVVYCFIDGVVAEGVASLWEEGDAEEMEAQNSEMV